MEGSTETGFACEVGEEITMANPRPTGKQPPSNPIYIKLVEDLKWLMDKRALTELQIAVAIGCTQPQVSRFLSGKSKNPSIGLLQALNALVKKEKALENKPISVLDEPWV